MISPIKPSTSTKRSKKPKPLFHLFTHGINTQSQPASSSSSPLGSGSSVPLPTSVINPPRRPRSKSVGRPTDQRSLARQQTFNKLCGDTPPPLPPMIPQKTTSTPTRRIRKYASAHDLEKAHQKEYQDLQANRHIPLPTTPTTRKLRHPPPPPDDDDDDDDIPLADAMRRLPLSPRSPHHHHHHHPQAFSPLSPHRTPYYHPNASLLNDEQEDDDDEDLVPIARLKRTDEPSFLRSAADKYKERVKERLWMED
ncbi:hypothetical protein BC941DRAFT_437853 [Chlamydoabsidia padenii]|nr:hypothetical protein BC941DRAFT_437853 [Chlamydoabsidia padenii]